MHCTTMLTKPRRHLVLVCYMALAKCSKPTGTYQIAYRPYISRELADKHVQSLDDVDFTVLAATSVLDDLIEKCPPAEACRDAFVRMSKATIKMCLSTTGFGNRGNFSNAQNRLGSIDAAANESMQNLNPNAPYFTSKQSQSNTNQKRRPEFDYDLRDLFSAEESAARPFVQYSNIPKISPAQRQALNMPQQMPILKAEPPSSAISPRQYPQYPGSQTSSTLTSPIMTTQMPQNMMAFSQQTSPGPYGTNISNSNTYSNFANQISNSYPGMSPFSDLDFLDTFPLGPTNQGGMSQNQAMDQPFNDFNMDFGMGWDGSLPATGFGDDSGGVDLFDGFFFGGQQG